MRARLALALALFATSTGMDAARAQQQPARASLSWQAPPGCATQAELQQKLTWLVQRPLVWGSGDESYRIDASVDQREPSWHVRVTLRDPLHNTLGTRELTSRTEQCRELDVPVALVMATLLDGLWEQRASGAALQRSAAVGAFVGTVLGFVPGLWLRAGPRVDLPGAWPLSLDASVYVPADRLDAQGRGAHYAALHAGVNLCPAVWSGARRASLLLCAELQGGALWGNATRLNGERSRALPLAFAGFSPVFEVPLSSEHLSAQLAVSGSWLFVRPRLDWSVAGEQQSLKSEPWMVGLKISLMGRLP